MPSTADGIVYPASSDNANLWEHFQNMADSIQTVIDAIQATQPTLVIKGVTEAVSSTTLQDDNELFCTLRAGMKYRVMLIASVTGTDDFKANWTFSGTLSTSTKNSIGPAASITTAGDTTVAMQPHAITTQHVYGCLAGAVWVLEELYLDVATDGVLQFQWAANGSAVSTSVLAASRLYVQPMTLAV